MCIVFVVWDGVVDVVCDVDIVFEVLFEVFDVKVDVLCWFGEYVDVYVMIVLIMLMFVVIEL